MRATFRMTTLGVAVLATGLMAGPAVAQDVEGFTSVGECQAAVRQVSDGADTDGISESLQTRIQALLDNGDPGAICTIYIPVDLEPAGDDTDVGGVVIDKPETPDTGGVSVDATQVLGRSLARTGADTGLLVLFGAGLLGLGAIAIRRPRTDDVG